MTTVCGCCPARRHPGRAAYPAATCATCMRNRAAAERCGVLLGGAPELVRLDEVRPAVYRVVWPCWRRAVSSAGRAGTGRTHRPPPQARHGCASDSTPGAGAGGSRTGWRRGRRLAGRGQAPRRRPASVSLSPSSGRRRGRSRGRGRPTSATLAASKGRAVSNGRGVSMTTRSTSPARPRRRPRAGDGTAECPVTTGASAWRRSPAHGVRNPRTRRDVGRRHIVGGRPHRRRSAWVPRPLRSARPLTDAPARA